jgi:hypothetical protein
MRHFISSFCRLIACILVMTVLTSGIAMAAYVCPELSKAAPMSEMMEGMPCAEMDKEKPVHCAEYQAGDKLALEHLAAAPALTPPTISFVIPVLAPVVPPVVTSFWPDAPSDPGTSPPYLRTQRLRI